MCLHKVEEGGQTFSPCDSSESGRQVLPKVTSAAHPPFMHCYPLAVCLLPHSAAAAAARGRHRRKLTDLHLKPDPTVTKLKDPSEERDSSVTTQRRAPLKVVLVCRVDDSRQLKVWRAQRHPLSSGNLGKALAQSTLTCALWTLPSGHSHSSKQGVCKIKLQTDLSLPKMSLSCFLLVFPDLDNQAMQPEST